MTLGLSAPPLWLTRNGALYRRWDALPRPRELRDLATYRAGRSLYEELWVGGYTMLSSRRARTLHRLAQTVARDGVRGALVDCGVWNGGSSVLMARGAPARPVWAFDSFAGLPEPSEVDGAESAAFAGDCVGSVDKVREGFARFAPDTPLQVRPGWFEDTLPAAAAEIGPIAVLHADGDWYESVRLTLEVL